MSSSMSAVLRTSNCKQNSRSNNFGFEMVCNENSQQKIVNRRSAVERLEETKANYVKTERVLDCKQNFEYSSNLHVSTGPQIDVLLKSRAKSLYNCQNVIKYVHSINLTSENAPPFTNAFATQNCGSFESANSPELKENCTLQQKDQFRRGYHEFTVSTDTSPKPLSRDKRALAQPIPDSARLNVNSCVQLSFNPGQCEYENDGHYTNAEKLEIRIEHSDNDGNSLEPSDDSFTPDDDIAEIEYKKQSSRTSDYVSRSSSFKCSVSSDRVKNLVKSFETKIGTTNPSTSANSISIDEKSKSVTRSKSDVNCRFSKSPCIVTEPNTTDTELERFFNTMGLDNNMFKSLTAPPRSPIHFFDSVSSVNSETNVSSVDSEDSALEVQKEGLTNNDLRKHAPTETSIVEKNARVVKWLYTCHNAYRKSTS